MSAVQTPETAGVEPPLPSWPEIMSLKTAARYMDRSYDSVWLLVRQMEIPAVRHGSRQFLRRVDIDRWAEKLLA